MTNISSALRAKMLDEAIAEIQAIEDRTLLNALKAIAEARVQVLKALPLLEDGEVEDDEEDFDEDDDDDEDEDDDMAMERQEHLKNKTFEEVVDALEKLLNIHTSEGWNDDEANEAASYMKEIFARMQERSLLPKQWVG